MTIPFTVVSVRPSEAEGLTVVTVTTPDHGIAHITVPDAVAQSDKLTIAVGNLLSGREATKDMLKE